MIYFYLAFRNSSVIGVVSEQINSFKCSTYEIFSRLYPSDQCSQSKVLNTTQRECFMANSKSNSDSIQ